jgi:SAM-dependent methyltransferase
MTEKDIYSQFEDKKREIEEWDSIVKKTISGGHELSFSSYLMLVDNRRLLLKGIIDYVSELLKQRRNSLILDLGGGDGFFLRCNAHLPLKGVVMDISRMQLCLGKRRNGGKTLDFIQADADFPPFKLKIFDVVIACGFLHHCSPRHEVMIERISSILKEDGRLIIVEGMAIGPAPSLVSILFFLFPRYLSTAIALLFYLLRNPSKIGLPTLLTTKTPSARIVSTLSGDQKAFLYPPHRPHFIALLSKYFRIVEIRYYTWLSAFVLDILVKIPAPAREKLISIFLPPLKILDKGFCNSPLKKYSHIYLVDCAKYSLSLLPPIIVKKRASIRMRNKA